MSGSSGAIDAHRDEARFDEEAKGVKHAQLCMFDGKLDLVPVFCGTLMLGQDGARQDGARHFSVLPTSGRWFLLKRRYLADVNKYDKKNMLAIDALNTSVASAVFSQLTRTSARRIQVDPLHCYNEVGMVFARISANDAFPEATQPRSWCFSDFDQKFTADAKRAKTRALGGSAPFPTPLRS